MTFGHYTAADAVFHRAMDEAARRVAGFAARLVTQMVAHNWGGTPVRPVAPFGPSGNRVGWWNHVMSGAATGEWRPDRRRITADWRRRKAARKFHARLRKMGRDKSGRRV